MRKPVKYLIVFVLICAAFSIRLCRCEASQDRPNVLFITLDTTRADHLGCYGDKKIKTPFIDGIAGRGTMFRNTITQVPLTFPSHTVMMTSTYPQFSNMWDNGGYRLDKNAVTLAQVLKDNGYSTAAFISSVVLDSKYGLNKGFDTYDSNIANKQGDRLIKFMDDERKANEVTPLAQKWLTDNKDKKFFMWVHYYDPHGIYNPPSPYNKIYGKDLYSGEIAFADHYIGELLGTLKDLGLDDNTMIVFCADHGEGLGEHGENGHGIFVYDVTLKVPLIFSYPKMIPQAKVIDEQARLIDIMPTILDVLGIKKNKEIQGQSLADEMTGKAAPQEHIAYSATRYAELHFNWSKMQSWRTRDWKLIMSTEPELYDLKKDPGETNNLYGARKDVAQKMEADLDDFLKVTTAPEKEENKMAVDEETKKQLMSLGYVSGNAAKGKAPVPIKMLKEMTLMNTADKLANSGKPDLAIEKYQQVINEDPDNMEAYIHIAHTYRGLKNFDEAIKYYKKAAAFKADNWEIHDGLGNIFKSMGRPEAAFKEFDLALKLDPDNPSVTNNLGWCYQQKLDFDNALEYYRKALKLDSTLATAHANIAICLRVKGKLDEAMEELQTAIKQDDKLAFAYAELGACLAIKGKVDEAIVQCRKAIELAPDETEGYTNLGVCLEMENRNEEALENYKKALEIAPWSPQTHCNMANVYIKLDEKDLAREHLRKALEIAPHYKKAIIMMNKLGQSDQ